MSVEGGSTVIESGPVKITIEVAQQAKSVAQRLAKGAESKWNNLVEQARNASRG